MKVTRWDSIFKPTRQQDRRRHPRSFLDLPLDYQGAEIPHARGGIAVNGGEGGLLIQCSQDLPIGTKLDVTVLFPDGFELANLRATVEIVRKEHLEEGDKGYRYGLKLVKMNKEDRLKLRHILTPPPMSQR